MPEQQPQQPPQPPDQQQRRDFWEGARRGSTRTQRGEVPEECRKLQLTLELCYAEKMVGLFVFPCGVRDPPRARGALQLTRRTAGAQGVLGLHVGGEGAREGGAARRRAPEVTRPQNKPTTFPSGVRSTS